MKHMRLYLLFGIAISVMLLAQFALALNTDSSEDLKKAQSPIVKNFKTDKGKLVIDGKKSSLKEFAIKINGRNIKIISSGKKIMLVDGSIKVKSDIELAYENGKLTAKKTKKPINILPSTIKQKLKSIKGIKIASIKLINEKTPKYSLKVKIGKEILGKSLAGMEIGVRIYAGNGAIGLDKSIRALIPKNLIPGKITDINASACNIALSEIELHPEFEALVEGEIQTIAREEAIQRLSEQNITTAGDLLNRLSDAGEFSQLAVLTGILPESLMKIALRAEMRCTFNGNSMSETDLDLLDAAGFRSVYQLSELNANSLQPKALSYYLEKIAIAKGPIYTGIGIIPVPQQIVAPSPEKIKEWINTAKNTSYQFATNNIKDEIIFEDGSEFVWEEELEEPESEKPICITKDLKKWQYGINYPVYKWQFLRLDVNLPYEIPNARIKVEGIPWDSNSAASKAERTLPGQSATLFVRIGTSGTYNVSLPDAAFLSNDITSNATLCFMDIERENAPENAFINLNEKDLRYFYITAHSTDSLNFSMSWNSGSTRYFIFTNYPAQESNSEYLGFVDQNNKQLDWNYPAQMLNEQKIYDWQIMLGHFTSYCIAQPECFESSLLSFFVSDNAAPSSLQFRMNKTTELEQFYVGTINRAVLSNDAESATWEGEINSFASLQLADAESATKTFGLEYPQFVYKEAEDHDSAFVKTPLIVLDAPIIAMKRAELSNYAGYDFTFTSYEDDSALLHYLNPATWLEAASDYIEASIHGIACVASFGAATTECLQAICKTISFVGDVAEVVSESEDEPYGTAALHFTNDSNFGLSGNAKSASFEISGSQEPNGIDWYDVVQMVGDTCAKIAGGNYTGAAKELASNLKPESQQLRWVKASYNAKIVDSIPIIDEIKVKLSKLHVYNDRDGTGKGSGDTYTYAMVATLGEKGALPEADWDGNPIPENKLKDLPFADADLLRYPQSGETDVDGGDDLTINKLVFERKYTSKHIAGIYVEFITFDSDNFEDDEIGITSRFYDFQEIVWALRSCNENREGYEKISMEEGDWCKISQKAGQWTREFVENDEVFGHHDSDVEYEIWLKPTIWP